jgi:outer membrane protein assembly factor BamB
MELWRANVGLGFSQVVVAQGLVYTMGWANGLDTVYCFSESSIGINPKPVWSSSYPCGTAPNPPSGTRATPTVYGNYVYTFSHEGKLNCWDRLTGNNVWYKNLGTTGRPGWGFASSPLVEGNLVIVNMGGHGFAVDATHPGPHNVVWGASDTGAAGYASPFAFTRISQRTVVIFGGNNVSGVDPANGNVLWFLPVGEGMADPIIYNDQVWASRGYGGGCRVAPLGSGLLTPLWSNTQMCNLENCSVLYNGYVYGASEGGGLRCVDFATGALAWSNAAFGTESAVMLANDELVVITGKYQGEPPLNYNGNGDLVIVKATPAGYTEVHRANGILPNTRTWITPTLANGKLYLRGYEGTMVCSDVSAVDTNAFSISLNNSSWPMGAVTVGGIAETWLHDRGHFTVVNNGGFPATLYISVSNSTPGGWIAGPSPGFNCFRMRWSHEDGSVLPHYQPVLAAPSVMTNGFGSRRTFKFDVEFVAPTSSSQIGVQQQIQINIRAVSE